MDFSQIRKIRAPSIRRAPSRRLPSTGSGSLTKDEKLTMEAYLNTIDNDETLKATLVLVSKALSLQDLLSILKKKPQIRPEEDLASIDSWINQINDAQDSINSLPIYSRSEQPNQETCVSYLKTQIELKKTLEGLKRIKTENLQTASIKDNLGARITELQTSQRTLEDGLNLRADALKTYHTSVKKTALVIGKAKTAAELEKEIHDSIMSNKFSEAYNKLPELQKLYEDEYNKKKGSTAAPAERKDAFEPFFKDTNFISQIINSEGDIKENIKTADEAIKKYFELKPEAWNNKQERQEIYKFFLSNIASKPECEDILKAELLTKGTLALGKAPSKRKINSKKEEQTFKISDSLINATLHLDKEYVDNITFPQNSPFNNLKTQALRSFNKAEELIKTDLCGSILLNLRKLAQVKEKKETLTATGEKKLEELTKKGISKEEIIQELVKDEFFENFVKIDQLATNQSQSILPRLVEAYAVYAAEAKHCIPSEKYIKSITAGSNLNKHPDHFDAQKKTYESKYLKEKKSLEFILSNENPKPKTDPEAKDEIIISPQNDNTIKVKYFNKDLAVEENIINENAIDENNLDNLCIEIPKFDNKKLKELITSRQNLEQFLLIEGKTPEEKNTAKTRALNTLNSLNSLNSYSIILDDKQNYKPRPEEIHIRYDASENKLVVTYPVANSKNKNFIAEITLNNLEGDDLKIAENLRSLSYSSSYQIQVQGDSNKIILTHQQHTDTITDLVSDEKNSNILPVTKEKQQKLLSETLESIGIPKSLHTELLKQKDIEPLKRSLSRKNSTRTTGKRKFWLEEAKKKDPKFVTLKIRLNSIFEKDDQDNNAFHILCKNQQLNQESVAQYLGDLIGCSKDPESLKAALNAKNVDGETPIHLLCKNSHITARPLKRAIEKLKLAGANIDEQNTYKSTPLTILCGRKDTYSAVNYLIEEGVNINHQDSNGLYAAYIASKEINMDAFKLLRSKGANLDIEISNEGQAKTARSVMEDLLKKPLPEISKNSPTAAQNPDIIRALDVSNANNNNNYNQNLLKEAQSDNFKEKIENIKNLIDNQNIEELRKNQNSIEEVKQEFNSLHYAISNEKESAIEHFLDNNLLLTNQDQHGNNSLHMAARYGNDNLFLLLSEKGVDITAANKAGETPLNLLNNKFKSVMNDNNFEAFKNTALDLKDNFRRLFSLMTNNRINILNETIENNQNQIAGHLIDEFSENFYKDGKLNTALHIAVNKGNTKLVEKLLKFKEADINSRSEEGDSAIHIAVKNNNLDMLKTLLEHDADISIKNKDGFTALSLCKDPAIRDVLLANIAEFKNISLEKEEPGTISQNIPNAIATALAGGTMLLNHTQSHRGTSASIRDAAVVAAAGGVAAWGVARLAQETYFLLTGNKNDMFVNANFGTTAKALEELEKTYCNPDQLKVLQDLEKEIITEVKKISPNLEVAFEKIKQAQVFREEMLANVNDENARKDIINKSLELSKHFGNWATIQKQRETSKGMQNLFSTLRMAAAGVSVAETVALATNHLGPYLGGLAFGAEAARTITNYLYPTKNTEQKNSKDNNSNKR